MMRPEEYRFAIVDGEVLRSGDFPTQTKDCFAVEIQGPYDYELIFVSSSDASDAAEAAVLAVDAYDEFEGKEVPWPGMFGGPFYHAEVWCAAAPDDRDKVRFTVRCDSDTGKWKAFSEEDAEEA